MQKNLDIDTNKVKINMIGGGFQHSISSNDLEPKYVEWVKYTQSAPISFHIDYAIMDNTNPTKKTMDGFLNQKQLMVVHMIGQKKI